MLMEIFVSLEDLPLEKFFVVVTPSFNEKLLGLILKEYNSLSKASNCWGFSLTSLYTWKKKSQYPLFLLVFLTKTSPLEIKELEQNILALKSGFNFDSNGGGTSALISPSFPIYYSKELFRILAHVFGDGCLSVDKYGYMNLSYYNQEKVLLVSFKSDIQKVFGPTQLRSGINKSTPFVRVPTPIAIILLLKISTFSSLSSQVPSFVLNSPLHLKKEFLMAIFDDEAHVAFSPPHRKIELTLANCFFLEQIKGMLLDFDIRTSKIYSMITSKGFKKYAFYITTNKYLNLFSEKIGFTHPLKKKSLQNILLHPGRIHYAHGETQEIILNLLKEKDMTVAEIAPLVCRKEVTVRFAISKLNSKHLVRLKSKTFKKGNRIPWTING